MQVRSSSAPALLFRHGWSDRSCGLLLLLLVPPGVCEHMTYPEIAERYPEIAKERAYKAAGKSIKHTTVGRPRALCLRCAAIDETVILMTPPFYPY